MAGGGSSELRRLAAQIMQLAARLLVAEQKIRELEGTGADKAAERRPAKRDASRQSASRRKKVQ